MKKKLMGIVTIIAIAAVAGYNVYASRSNVKLSDLALANVEALADSSEGSQSDCNTYCMVSYFDTCIHRYTNNTFTTCYDSRIRRSN